MSESASAEEIIGTQASQLLEHGRKNWDNQHSRAAAFYAKTLASAASLDTNVLGTAALLHDIGWSTLQWNEGQESAERMSELKKLHMVNGKKMALEILNRPDVKPHYTSQQIERIAYLVGIHDDPSLVNEPDAVVLWEADTLGQIDLTRVTPTVDYAGGSRIFQGIISKRQPKFQTPLGKLYLSNLLPAYKAYIDGLNDRK